MPTVSPPKVSMSLTVTSNHIQPMMRRMHINADLAAGRSARIIAKDAADAAPYLTGALQESIRAVRDGDGWVVIVEVDYGGYVEFGSMYMPAQPFLLPAAMRRFPDFADDMRNSIMFGGVAGAIFG
jgi:HK97 gp10 family phage protein